MHNSGRTAVGALLALTTFAGTCALVDRVPMKPGFELERVEFVGFTLEAAKLTLHTKVTNPYPVALPRAQLVLKLKVEGTELADLNGEEKEIPARATAPVRFDVAIPYTGLQGVYSKFPGKEELLLELAGKLNIPVPRAARLSPSVPEKLSFAFEAKRNLPAVLPSVSIANFRIIKPDAEELKKKIVATVTKNPAETVKKAATYLDSLLKKGGSSPGSAAQAGLDAVDIEIRTEFEILLENRAAARLEFRDLNYEFFMNDQRFLVGRGTRIESRGTKSTVKVVTTFPLKSVSVGLSEAIKSRRVQYRLLGGASVRIPALGGEPVLCEFNHVGNHNW